MVLAALGPSSLEVSRFPLPSAVPPPMPIADDELGRRLVEHGGQLAVKCRHVRLVEVDLRRAVGGLEGRLGAPEREVRGPTVVHRAVGADAGDDAADGIAAAIAHLHRIVAEEQFGGHPLHQQELFDGNGRGVARGIGRVEGCCSSRSRRPVRGACRRRRSSREWRRQCRRSCPAGP